LKLLFADHTHASCIKSIGLGGPFLVSGSTDEVIK
jgi:hypothetical protein